VSEDVDSVDLSDYSIAVVVGNVKQEILQKIFESSIHSPINSPLCMRVTLSL
jgi:hypothetical protein